MLSEKNSYEVGKNGSRLVYLVNSAQKVGWSKNWLVSNIWRVCQDKLIISTEWLITTALTLPGGKCFHMLVVGTEVGDPLSFLHPAESSLAETRSGSGPRRLSSRQMLKSLSPFCACSWHQEFWGRVKTCWNLVVLTRSGAKGTPSFLHHILLFFPKTPVSVASSQR